MKTFLTWQKPELAPGKLVHLVRPNGSSTGLAYDDKGSLRSLHQEVRGKAEKKRVKRIRAALRRQPLSSQLSTLNSATEEPR